MGAGGSKTFGVFVNIGANFNELRKAFGETKNIIQNSVAEIKSSSAELKKFGKIATGISASIVGLGYMVMKTFGQFEQSMANAGSVMGATAAEMQILTNYARKMGETSVFSASEAADAMYYLASAGLNVEQTMGALKGTLDLAAATQYDLAETTRIVVSNLSAFQLKAEEADRVSNLFAASISGSQATMLKLGETMKYVGPVANAFGISIEQATAAASLLYNAGIDGSQAGTNLRQSLLALAKPTQMAEEALRKYGLTAEDVSPVNNDLISIVDKLSKAGMGNKKAMGDLATIFDKRAAPAMKVLLNAGAEGFKKFEDQITGTNKATSMAAMQVDTFEGAMKILKSAIQETAIQFGTALVPVLRSVIATIQSVVQWFNAMPKGIKTAIAAIAVIAAAVLGFVGPLSLLLGMLPAITAGVGVLGTAMSALLSPVGLTIAAIAALAAGTMWLMGAEDRRMEAMAKGIQRQKESLNTQVKYQKSIKDMADEYKTLAATQNRSEEQEKRMQTIHDEMRQKYPDIISKTSDYASAVDQIALAGKKAEQELGKLSERQKTLARSEMQMNITSANKSMRESMDELEGIITDNMESNIAKVKGGISRLQYVFDKFAKVPIQSSEKILGSKTFEIKDMFPNLISDIRSGKMQVIDELNDMAAKASEMAGKVQFDIAEGKRDSDKGGAQMELAIWSQIAAKYEEAAVSANTYAQSLQTLEESQTKLKEINNKPDAKKDGGEVPLTDEEIEEQARIDEARKKANAEAAAERKAQADKQREEQRQIADAANKIGEDAAKSELERLKALGNETLEKRKAIAIAENALNMAQITKANQERIKTATEGNVELSKVEQIFNNEKETEAMRHKKEMDDIEKEFIDKAIDKQFNMLKSGEQINKDELNQFRAMLVLKMDALRANGLAFEAEYMALMGRVKEIDELFNSDDNKILKGLEDSIAIITAKMEEAKAVDNMSDWQAQAAEMTALLQTKLDTIAAMHGATSIEYLEAMRDMREHKKAIEEEMSADTKFWVDNFSGVIMSGFDGAMDSWVESGDLASIRIKDIFSDIGKSFRQMVAKMVTDFIQSKIISLLTSVISGGVGSVLPSASLFSSAVGSETRTSGAQNLHSGEGAAQVTRRNSAFYKQVAMGASGITPITKTGVHYTPKGTVVIPKRIMQSLNGGGSIIDSGTAKLHKGEGTTRGVVTAGVGNNSVVGISDSFSRNSTTAPVINLNINGAVVDDQKYWDNVFDKHIVPAINNSNKRYIGA